MGNHNEISGMIIGAAFRIHSKLGPGLLESIYGAVLARDLAQKGLYVERQKRIPLVFEGMYFDESFRADLVIAKTIIVEIKSVRQLAPVHSKQLLSYVRILDYRLGLLLNFGAASLAIKRIANRL